MPQATNLVVKNGAVTPVDKTFTLLAPAAGYNSVAEWALKEGVISSVFPKFTAMASDNRQSSSKKVQLKFRLPSSYTDSVTGLTAVSSAFEFNGSVTIPDDFPEALKADAVAFVVNLIGTALVQSMIRDGAPAT